MTIQDLQTVARDFVDTIEKAEHYRTQKGGQQVPYHGDFSHVTPSVAKALAYWAKSFESTLEGLGEAQGPIRNLIRLLRTHSVVLAPPGKPFVLASGATSEFFLDVKKTALLAEGHRLLGELMSSVVIELFREHVVVSSGTLSKLDQPQPQPQPLPRTAVAGVELGGCSLASSVSYCTSNFPGYPAIYVRKEPKDHGTGQLIESPVSLKDLWVVLLEDVVTTGGSSMKAVQALQDAGSIVVGVVAVVDRNQGAGKVFANAGLTFRALVGVDEILSQVGAGLVFLPS